MEKALKAISDAKEAAANGTKVSSAAKADEDDDADEGQEAKRPVRRTSSVEVEPDEADFE